MPTDYLSILPGAAAAADYNIITTFDPFQTNLRELGDPTKFQQNRKMA
jgi:hypothetical protein